MTDNTSTLDPILRGSRSGGAKLTRRVESLRRIACCSRSRLRHGRSSNRRRARSVAICRWTRSCVLCSGLSHGCLEEGFVVAAGFDEFLVELLEVI